MNSVVRYAIELKKWVLVGKPIRTKTRIMEIHSICKECPLFGEGGGWLSGYDKCKECGCNLHSSKTDVNKIAMATTECPHPEGSRWVADVDENGSIINEDAVK